MLARHCPQRPNTRFVTPDQTGRGGPKGNLLNAAETAGLAPCRAYSEVLYMGSGCPITAALCGRADMVRRDEIE